MKSERRLARLSALGFALIALVAAGPSMGVTTKTATFLVNLTITSDCAIATNPLAFGSSGVIAAVINQTTTLSITCSNTTPYNVGLDAGNVSGSTVAARLLANGATTMSFQMYSDSGRTTVWGNTIGTNTVTGTGNGSAQTLTIYGQVPVQATPTANTYSSTVTASVTF